MSNHLANESSPYLLQHADNPVDWFPWGDEALRRAQEQSKPILLSIGYAACHWCHVMAHESFEDESTAELMNRWFINVKVDREERPDLDSIYMAAVTRMTGHGGWPMTVFLTPDAKPFFSGTYYPPQPRYGMPSFRQVLEGIADAWSNRQEEVLNSATNVTQQLQDALPEGDISALQHGVLQAASQVLAGQFDVEWGGFGTPPKFPQPMVLEFLLREHLRTGEEAPLNMVTFTLRQMAHGGMYDQIGGGFARYSTDREWLVPHFEKMLYDNAQLARIFLRAWQVTREPLFRQVVEQTLDYVMREMRHDEGGFYSSQDADSEGEEGRFFVWSADEIRAVLGTDADLFMQVYDVTKDGNWDGKNILRKIIDSAAVAEKLGLDTAQAGQTLAACRQKLYEVRSQRVCPGLDDKVLTSWNGLMLGALAEAGRVLGRDDYLAAAGANAQFLWQTLRRGDGRLLRTWKADASARYNGYLEDYACLAEGLLALYEAGFDPRWYRWACELADIMLARFPHDNGVGFYDTSDDHEKLIHRPRDVQDNAMPSGNAKAAMVLFRLGLYSGETHYTEAAEHAFAAVADLMQRHPAGFGEWLSAASFMLGQPRELALLGPLGTLEDMLAVVNERYQPTLVVAAGQWQEAAAVPLLAGRTMVGGQPTAYFCERFACQGPVTGTDGLRQLLDKK